VASVQLPAVPTRVTSGGRKGILPKLLRSTSKSRTSLGMSSLPYIMLIHFPFLLAFHYYIATALYTTAIHHPF